MFNVQRLLGDRIGAVVDAMQPGGSVDPFSTLSLHEREELSNLYRLGFPRGDEFMISQPFGQIWLWTSIADMLIEEDADYFSAFWSRSEEHTSELQSLMRISYAVFCLKKKNYNIIRKHNHTVSHTNSNAVKKK